MNSKLVGFTFAVAMLRLNLLFIPWLLDMQEHVKEDFVSSLYDNFWAAAGVIVNMAAFGCRV